jgi:multiple antibiotic resistance protein
LRLAAWVIGSCALVLFTFLLLGRQILDQLNIDLASFKIGGGMILLQFGFSMLRGKAIRIKEEGVQGRASLQHRVMSRFREIFIPIGVPVIAGPGAITTVIIYGFQSADLFTTAMLCLTLAGVLAALLAVLLIGPLIQRLTGDLPLRLVSRLFGMILIAIAVQFMVDGLTEVFPAWAAIPHMRPGE